MAVTAAVSLGEAKEFLRLDGADEDALVARLIVAATEACELFTGCALVRREIVEFAKVSSWWQRLEFAPVAAVTLVEGVPTVGAAFAMAPAAHEIDIDAKANGWVRAVRQGTYGRLRVTYEAGLAADAAGVPEGLKQGVLRMTAHLFAHRDCAEDAGPPRAVTTLWRPWRRVRL